MKFAIVSLVALTSFISSVPTTSPNAGSSKKNMIMMVSDGFGPASETLARAYV
ncbi:hypothetical protein AYI70_g11019, partial [Smittium culicis]